MKAIQKKLFLSVLLVGTPAMSGCSDDGVDVCNEILGHTYTAVAEKECGLGPTGVTLCRWSVIFGTDGRYEWRHSDVTESGTYSCDGNRITGERSAGAASIAGQLDAATGQLTWDDDAYVMTR